MYEWYTTYQKVFGHVKNPFRLRVSCAPFCCCQASTSTQGKVCNILLQVKTISTSTRIGLHYTRTTCFYFLREAGSSFSGKRILYSITPFLVYVATRIHKKQTKKMNSRINTVYGARPHIFRKWYIRDYF